MTLPCLFSRIYSLQQEYFLHDHGPHRLVITKNVFNRINIQIKLPFVIFFYEFF